MDAVATGAARVRGADVGRLADVVAAAVKEDIT
jgi:hypothetical protein